MPKNITLNYGSSNILERKMCGRFLVGTFRKIKIALNVKRATIYIHITTTYNRDRQYIAGLLKSHKKCVFTKEY